MRVRIELIRHGEYSCSVNLYATFLKKFEVQFKEEYLFEWIENG